MGCVETALKIESMTKLDLKSNGRNSIQIRISVKSEVWEFVYIESGLHTDGTFNQNDNCTKYPIRVETALKIPTVSNLHLKSNNQKLISVVTVYKI